MPKPKLLLRDFLIEHLDEGKTNSLQWVNKEEQVFMLHWIHANSPNWIPEDATIFKEWAAYKGRYHQDADGTWPIPDYTTWKANFRCAVNRSHDLEEVKIEGNTNKDVKYYRILPRKARRQFEIQHQWYGSDSQASSESTEEQPTSTMSIKKEVHLSTDSINTICFSPDTVAQYLPEVVEEIRVSPPSSLGSAGATGAAAVPELQYHTVDILDLLNFSDDPDESVSKLSQMASMESFEINPQAFVVELPESLSLLTFGSAPRMTDMCVWLRYRDYVIQKPYVTDPSGCRITNVDGKPRQAIPEKFQGCALIGTPSPSMYYDSVKEGKYAESTERILEAVGNGLHLHCDNSGNIYATRLTNCRIYLADPTVKNGSEPVTLPRHSPVKVFDRETFEGKLWQWKERKGPEPSVSVLFALGEPWSLSKPINKCHVTVTVVHAYSVFQKACLKKTFGSQSLPIDVDTESSFPTSTSNTQ